MYIFKKRVQIKDKNSVTKLSILEVKTKDSPKKGGLLKAIAIKLLVSALTAFPWGGA